MTALAHRVSAILCLWALSGCLFTADEITPAAVSNGGPSSPSAVFALLTRAYENRSVTTLGQILSSDYLFQADAASLINPAENTWGKDVELDRHRRMFQAIQNVTCSVMWDSLSPKPESAPRETTWTVYSLEMTMDYDGQSYDVRGQADFRLRAEPQTDGSNRYQIVKWTDRNQ